jgi:hypothetical protein
VSATLRWVPLIMDQPWRSDQRGSSAPDDFETCTLTTYTYCAQRHRSTRTVTRRFAACDDEGDAVGAWKPFSTIRSSGTPRPTR